jgi:hypothetical protein
MSSDQKSSVFAYFAISKPTGDVEFTGPGRQQKQRQCDSDLDDRLTSTVVNESSALLDICGRFV